MSISLSALVSRHCGDADKLAHCRAASLTQAAPILVTLAAPALPPHALVSVPVVTPRCTEDLQRRTRSSIFITTEKLHSPVDATEADAKKDEQLLPRTPGGVKLFGVMLDVPPPAQSLREDQLGHIITNAPGDRSGAPADLRLHTGVSETRANRLPLHDPGKAVSESSAPFYATTTDQAKQTPGYKLGLKRSRSEVDAQGSGRVLSPRPRRSPGVVGETSAAPTQLQSVSTEDYRPMASRLEELRSQGGL